jgi:hypothetical protein
MKIKITDLVENPFRNIKHYPIAREKVKELKTSIRETSFWDNILIRPAPKNGNYEVAYGHHRLIALRELLKEGQIKNEVDLPCKDISDAVMVKIMANENLDSWKTTPVVIKETIKTIKDFLDNALKSYTWESAEPQIRGLFTEKRFYLEAATRSVGRGLIARFLGDNWTEDMVHDALKLLEDEKNKIVDKDAINMMPTLGDAVAFYETVKDLDIPLGEQKAMAQEAVEQEKQGKGVRSTVIDIQARKNYAEPKKKKKVKEVILLDLLQKVSDCTRRLKRAIIDFNQKARKMGVTNEHAFHKHEALWEITDALMQLTEMLQYLGYKDFSELRKERQKLLEQKGGDDGKVIDIHAK